MRTLLFSCLFFLSLTGLRAQGCKSATAVFSDLNAKLTGLMKKHGCELSGPSYADACLDAVSKYDKISREMVSYWNKNARSWSTIGPRRLDFGEWNQGRIVSTGGRMFISTMPARKNTMTVDIKEIDGKGKVSYAICKVDRHGNCITLKTGFFNENSKAKSNKRQSRSITLNNVKGRLLTIHFDGKSVGNTFQYQVKMR